MIASEAEIKTMLGLSSSITAEESAAIALFRPKAESEVVRYLGYNPEQLVRTEYYPRTDSGAYVDGGIWDVNAAHTHARFESTSVQAAETLQLLRLPVRKIEEVRVDRDARHGDRSTAFGDGTVWAQGDDYWAEWDETQAAGVGVCLSGLLIASGSWPRESGTVRVRYRAGYSAAELSGAATASAVADSGVVTTEGVNASQIKFAVLLTVAKAMNTWAQMKKKARAGFQPLKSEKVGDYSWSGADGMGLLAVSLPAEAAECLDPFRHWGLMRT